MICGDLNSRTGRRQTAMQTNANNNQRISQRGSCDVVVNGYGEKILDLCDEYGLGIVNGCTQGDQDGEFTFLGAQSSSSNDYWRINVERTNAVVDLKVGIRQESDNQPLEITLNIAPEVKAAGQKRETCPRLRNAPMYRRR